ncbi:MAG: isoprenylcysteine carboxylmethyltransferase family protein [Acidobacteria bacterium]|nr:isoprenylcysteine carboxylmethyltransferase family protein [Acidobacteriota bacterium]
MSGDFSTRAQKIRVPAGFLYAAVFMIFSQPTWKLALAGFLIAFSGLAIRVWAAGCIEKSRELEVRGPYRYTRNPLYLGSFLVGLGSCIAAANTWLAVLFVGFFAGIYGPVMKREEAEMQQLFPRDFFAYQRSVPFFFPRFSGKPLAPAAGPSGRAGAAAFSPAQTAPENRRFQWARLWRNREYNAILGFIAVFIWIWLRLLWSG